MSFSQLPAVKKTFFLVHPKQIFNPAYFVRALAIFLESFHGYIYTITTSLGRVLGKKIGYLVCMHCQGLLEYFQF